MIILGLGSNVGDRLGFLRKGIRALLLSDSRGSLKVKTLSPVYVSNPLLPEGAPSSWEQPYLNINVWVESTLEPEELFRSIKTIESQLGREVADRWAPRIIDIDILAIDDLVYETKDLNIPHIGLIKRSFAIRPFADLNPQWTYPVPGDFFGNTAHSLARICDSLHPSMDTRRHTQTYTELMGVINLTPDSFSTKTGKGSLPALEYSIENAHQMIEGGIHFLDLGAESTRPGAENVSPQEEWKRLEPLLKSLVALSSFSSNTPPSIRLSIDTRHPEVARKALKAGAHCINDVCGFSTLEMQDAVLESNSDLVFMHSLTVPPQRGVTLSLDADPVDELLLWAEARIKTLQTKGIHRDRMIFDPGLGFGKTPEQSWKILRDIRRFRELGVRILVGHSRKSFLSSITSAPAPDRDLETVALSLDLIEKGVDIVRVHNTDWHLRALKAWIHTQGVTRWGC